MGGIIKQGKHYNNVKNISVCYYRTSINSDENEAVVVKLISEVQGINPSYNAADIRG